MKEEHTFNIEFKDILEAIKKRFYIFILIVVPALLLGTYLGDNTKKSFYEVRASLIVGSYKKYQDYSVNQRSDEVGGITQFTTTYSAIVSTMQVLDKTVKRLNLNIKPMELRNNIIATPHPETPIIDIKLRWTSSDQIGDILDTLIDVYLVEANIIIPRYEISVLEKIKTPEVIQTSNKRMYIVVSMVAGLTVSLLLIFAMEFMNNNLKTEDDIKECLELPVLGVILKQNKKVNKINSITIGKLEFAFNEAFRTIRTNIYNMFIDTSTIVVTSGMQGDGKTVVASILAVVLAQDGKKTILIDCNLRKPNIHRMFNLSETGLTNILIGGEWTDIVQTSEIENLSVITAGFRPSNPAELISQPKLQELIEVLRDEYDYIILDTPPIGLVTDAQILAQSADGYLLVISSENSELKEIIKAKRLIQYAGGKILGTLFNNVKDPTINKKYKHYHRRR